MDNGNRLITHQKNHKVEELLQELEKLLNPVEEKVLEDLQPSPRYPIFYIVGCARSGSTILFQYLSDTKVFCYPSNLISRFYFAPYLGGRIHQLLVDYDVKREIFGNDLNTKYISQLGKTKGADAPHEFWYFWRRFFKFGEHQMLSPEELSTVNIDLFLKELTAFQNVFYKPLLMKAMILNWNIPFLGALNSNIFFIYIKRNIAFNAQSLLMARNNFFGNKTDWYSFKPPEYEKLKLLTPEQQVVNQVYHTNKSIEFGLSQLPNNRYIEINYEAFCNSPNIVFDLIKNKFKLDYSNETNKDTPAIEDTNQIKVSDEEWENIHLEISKII